MAAVAKFRILVRNGKDAIVRPPSDVCEKGMGAKKVSFRNMTAGTVHISLPGGVFDANNNGVADPAQIIVLAPTGANPPLEIPVLASVSGIFQFKVFCEETFTVAQGNSDPEFIVEN